MEISYSTEIEHYYPFGMAMPGRSFSSNQYRYGFNGKEKDEPGIGGGGSTYDYGFRIYNPQIAKFLSVDPLTKEYPWYTPYQFAGNKPIWAIDLDGLEEYYASSGELLGKYGESTEIRIVYDKHVNAAVNLLSGDNMSVAHNDILYNRSSAAYSSQDDVAIGWGQRFNKVSIDTKKEIVLIYYFNIYKGEINFFSYRT